MPYELPREKATQPADPENPVKVRVETVQAPASAPGNLPAEVKVVAVKEGEVNFFDRMKKYYHTVITVIGAILVLLNQVTPMTEMFGGSVKEWTTAAIVFVTALLNFLKSNEVWVNKL